MVLADDGLLDLVEHALHEGGCLVHGVPLEGREADRGGRVLDRHGEADADEHAVLGRVEEPGDDADDLAVERHQPTATTSSPGRRPLVERIVAGMMSSGRVFACSTARSCSARWPMSCASDSCPSENVTWMRLAPLTTCRLVRMMPDSTITTPVPRCTSALPSAIPLVPSSPSSAIARTATTEGRIFSNASVADGLGGISSIARCTKASTCAWLRPRGCVAHSAPASTRMTPTSDGTSALRQVKRGRGAAFAADTGLGAWRGCAALEPL